MIALSYSRLSTFEQCGTKFEHLYVLKDVTDSGSEATVYGTRVHEALEDYSKAVVSGVAIAEQALSDGKKYREITKFLPVANAILRQPGDKYFEYQMALDADRDPCDWFAPEVWLRGIADVLIVDGDTAFIGDWKTGKVRDNPLQLKLFACMVMAMFPKVNKVTTAFIWLLYDDVTTMRFSRDDLPDLWGSLDPRLAAVQDAVDLGVFKSKPSPLCNWCPAKGICPDRRTR